MSVECTKGIVIVSKLKIVLVAFEVNPSVMRFGVVIAFETYKLPVTVRVASGIVVPIPMLLLELTKRFEVEIATPEL